MHLAEDSGPGCERYRELVAEKAEVVRQHKATKGFGLMIGSNRSHRAMTELPSQQ
jgi:hypothetical protein